MKKKGLIILIMLTILSGCSTLKAVKKESELNGVTVEIQDVSMKENSKKPGHYVLTFNANIINNSTFPLMKVSYTVSILDKDGNVLRDISFFYQGVDKAVQVGESIKKQSGTQFDLDEKPYGYSVRVDETMDNVEMPEIHLPQPGENLYQALNSDNLSNIKENKPVKIALYIDHGGPRDIYEVSDAEKIDEIVDLFTKITIGKQTNEYVTDNYNSIGFTFADGQEVYISLNLYNLETRVYNQEHLYELNNLQAFIQKMKESV